MGEGSLEDEGQLPDGPGPAEEATGTAGGLTGADEELGRLRLPRGQFLCAAQTEPDLTRR